MDLKKRRFHLEVTGKCNIECAYCYNSDFNNRESIKNELTLDEIKLLIGQAVEIGCSTFIFSGGEPFLHPNFIEILKTCPESSRASAITNASFLSEELIKELKGIKQLKELKISWDGFRAHNEIRKGSDYMQIVNAIGLLKEHLPECKLIINTMTNRYSVDELLDLYNELKELGIKHWRIDMPFNSGRYTNNRNDLSNISFEKIISIYKNLLIAYFSDNKPMILEIFNVYKSEVVADVYHDFNLEEHPCSYYNNTITVRPNGDITFCPSLAFPISNWKENHDLESTIISAYKHPYFDLKISELNGCSSCKYLKLCGGGCRADAITWLNSKREVDPISCSVMPLIEKEILPVLPDNERQIFEVLINKYGDLPRSKRDIFEII